MRFMIIVKASAASDTGGEPADGDVLVEMMKFHDSLMRAGVVRWVEALEPSSRGVRVQYAAGQRTVIPGPFPTPQELIAGFWIIEISSREQAVEWGMPSSSCRRASRVARGGVPDSAGYL
jgi:hypothetical protein